MKINAEKILKARVVLLHGDELVLRRETLEDLITTVGGDEFDRETVQGDSRGLVDWAASAGTVPFMSARRTVIVRNLQRASVPDDAVSILKSLPEFALVILVHEEGTGGARDPLKAWEKAVKAAGGEIVEAKAPESKVLEKLIRDRAQQEGKSMSGPAAAMLVEMCGGNYSRSVDEVEKLVLFVGAAPEITQSDVQVAATPSREWNIFKLVDAVVAAQPGVALRQLRLLVGGSHKADDAANSTILPLLGRQFRLLWQAKAVVRSGQALSATSAQLPDKNNLAKEKDFVRQRTLDAAKKVSIESVERCLDEIADADARLKGQLAAVDAMETLETLVLQCCDHVRMRPR